jgi:hypothetical protein
MVFPGYRAELGLFYAEFPSNWTYKQTCPLNRLEGSSMLDVKEEATLGLVLQGLARD